MNPLLLANARLLFPGERIAPGALVIERGTITRVLDSAETLSADTTREIERIDCGGRLLTPGLIDIHTHGIGRHFYHPEQAADDFNAALRRLPRHGTTCVLPTFVPGPNPRSFEPLAGLLRAVDGAGSTAPGFHVEGPFVALGGAACPTLPGDTALLEEMIAASGETIRIMSLSPEQQGVLPVIEALARRGIRPFLTHTRATVEQTEAAIAAGARHATHFYDVFPVPQETDPGVRPSGAVEAILADPSVTVDFICDGVHVHPAAVRMALAAKGFAGVTLITDSNIGAGLPPGVYDTPWGYPVRVRVGDGARHATEGFLAGSALTMDAGIRNLSRWLRLPLEQLFAMATLNPARILGLDTKGRIARGADADLVLWDDRLCPVKTWVSGRCCFNG